MERLTKISEMDGLWTIKDKDCCATCDFKTRDCKICPILTAFTKLAAYEDAEEEGRLVVLPFKLGETVWEVLWGPKKSVVKERNITHALIGNLGAYWFDTGLTTGFSAVSIGKTVFLTREEAEASLKKEAQHEH